VSPLASLKFGGQVLEAFSAAKLNQKYFCGKGYALKKILNKDKYLFLMLSKDCVLLFLQQRFGLSV